MEADTISLPDIDPRYISELSEAFRTFSDGTEKMKQMYAQLEGRVAFLTDQLHQKNKELERANRLASIGQLAAGVAHEIRNPLGGIELCATMLQKELSADADKRDLADNIVEGVRRLNTIVMNLLTFARDNRLQIRPVDARGLIEQAVSAIEPHIARNRVAVLRRGFDKPCIVDVDAGQLRQVFINVMLNAVEAMPDGGELTAVIGRVCATDRVRIDISDTGCGIAKECMDKIFNPFFTTKDTGTGLGLAISHTIVEKHEGSIGIDSVPGMGTTIHIFLPAKLSMAEDN